MRLTPGHAILVVDVTRCVVEDRVRFNPYRLRPLSAANLKAAARRLRRCSGRPCRPAALLPLQRRPWPVTSRTLYAEELVVCDPSAPTSVVIEAALSGAPPGRTARLSLDLGCADAEVAAVARDLARGVLTQLEAMLADPAPELPAHLRDALAALADALAEQTEKRATVTTLNTPLARAWRDHPAGRGRGDPPAPDRRGDPGPPTGEPAARVGEQRPTLIGFHCPVCGFTRRGEESRPVSAPICAGWRAGIGSKVRTSTQHDPTPMQALVLH